MKYCGNSTLQAFTKMLVDTLKEENECRGANGKKLNIPFLISTLCQSFEKDEILYNQFIFDLEVTDHYDILISDSNNDYYGICKADVYFYETPDEKNNYESELNFKYEIDFTYDERNYGYCECTSSDPDYREDKQCCGHGCDFDAPKFEMRKSLLISNCSWDGDEHDYWDFEDKFYANDNEENRKKKLMEREYKIKDLEETIRNAQKQLNELKENNER